MIAVNYTEIIEITLTAGTLKYKLGDREILRGKNINSIVVFDSGQKSKDGADIADPKDAYLQLKAYGNNEIIHDMPCKSLLFTPGYPVLQFVDLQGVPIDWEKSEIFFAAGTVLTTGQIVQMMIVYDDANKTNRVRNSY